MAARDDMAAYMREYRKRNPMVGKLAHWKNAERERQQMREWRARQLTRKQKGEIEFQSWMTNGEK